MRLKHLGFDAWFQNKQQALQRPDCSPARVTAVNRDNYAVQNETGQVLAEPAGRLLFSAETGMDLPCVGDWVMVQYYNADTLAIIHEVYPRKSFLCRKTPGKKIDYQMIAANIDVAFIVQGCDLDFNVRRLERYLIMVNDGHIEPVLLLTKSDLIDENALQQRIAIVRQSRINCKIIALSNYTGIGLDQIRQVMEAGKTYCLLGSSGVGKTTLLNHLIGKDLFETNTVREKDGRGRHTTSRRQLIILDNGAMIIDTPGMRELGNIGVSAGLDESFSDILELAENCRFADCSHTRESGCAILAAIENGELNEQRYQSYIKLRKESDYHQMSYIEKRRKDKMFGKHVKAVLKNSKKK